MQEIIVPGRLCFLFDKYKNFLLQKSFLRADMNCRACIYGSFPSKTVRFRCRFVRSGLFSSGKHHSLPGSMSGEQGTGPCLLGYDKNNNHFKTNCLCEHEKNLKGAPERLRPFPHKKREKNY